jgi:hypothetical protein
LDTFSQDTFWANLQGSESTHGQTALIFGRADPISRERGLAGGDEDEVQVRGVGRRGAPHARSANISLLSRPRDRGESPDLVSRCLRAVSSIDRNHGGDAGRIEGPSLILRIDGLDSSRIRTLLRRKFLLQSDGQLTDPQGRPAGFVATDVPAAATR